MKQTLHFLILLISVIALHGCGGGGGDRAQGVESGPSEPNQPVDPPPPILPPGNVSPDDIESTDQVEASIGEISVNSPPTIAFTLSVNSVQTVSGLTTSNARFSLARLVTNAGSAAGEHWESYIETSEDPICRSSDDVNNSINQCTTFTTETDPGLIDDSARKVQDVNATGKVATTQATYERSGTLTEGEDGQWLYTYAADIGDPTLRNEVHRACIQFSLPASVDNVCVDFVPALLADSATAPMGSSLHSEFYNSYSGRQIATEATCNTCHDKLAIHGGGRTQVEYCVTCHNPGTVDANSEHNLDMASMVHKIHNGRNLPSLVDDGVPYTIWGYRNSAHDYSGVSYPQPVTQCTRCHAGEEDIDFANAQGLPLPEAEITADGHSWVSNPTLLACVSCHEKLTLPPAGLKLNGDVPSTNHVDYTQETNCAGCHRDRGPDAPGGLQADQAHRDLLTEEGLSQTLMINGVANGGVGQTPLVDIIVELDGVALNLQDAAEFCANATFDVRIAWDGANEFLNVDGGGVGSGSPRIRGAISPAGLIDQGGNVFRIDTATLSNTATIPAGIDSIAVMVDTNYPDEDCAGGNTVRLDSVVSHFATDGGDAEERRDIVDVALCANCHGRYVSDTHANRGVNNPLVCTSCHNPNRRTSGSSHDLSVTVHAVHASDFRDTPFKGSWDHDRLQFPGDLTNCEGCHSGSSHTLPLPLQREPVLSETGVYTTPIAAVCGSCHDGGLAQAHMETAGGAVFDDTYANAAAVTETCDICHGDGAAADVETVHNK